VKRIILKKNEDERIKNGHPWVYDNEIGSVLEGFGPDERPAELQPGEIADVESARKEYLGRAFVNPHSKIRARIFSASKEGVDKGFFKNRIRSAIAHRFSYTGADSMRLVFAEADSLPGLIIDRYVGVPAAGSLVTSEPGGPPTESPPDDGNERVDAYGVYYVVQILCYGMDLRRQMIVEALLEVSNMGDAIPPVRAVIEKSTAGVREKEGLSKREGVLWGSYPESGIVIFENDIPFLVDLAGGQKTGLFLDQRDNHRVAGEIAGNLACKIATSPAADGKFRVLDAFSYTGGFSISIARALSAIQRDYEIISVDESAPALGILKKNAALQRGAIRQEAVTSIREDVFKYFGSLVKDRKPELFDMIVLDPPAFAKSHKTYDEAIKGYREINSKAFMLLKKGGVLVSCSCSQAVSEWAFREMIFASARGAGRRIIEVKRLSQSSDHPVLAGYEESHYLKCGVYLITK
jgi:23S rRNA (cytosine1962-C5)-methyltransferase